MLTTNSPWVKARLSMASVLLRKIQGSGGAMVIGLLTGDLHFPENTSIKEKRMLLQKLMGQLKQRLNVSVAEVEYQDLWQRSQLAVACVNTSAREANAALSHALNIIDRFYELELLNHHIEMR